MVKKKIKITNNKFKTRLIVIILLSIFLFVIGFNFIKENFSKYTYDLGKAESLLVPIIESTVDKISFNEETKTFDFNNGQSFISSENIQTGATNISTTIYENPKNGLTLIDSINNLEFNLKPNYPLRNGQQDSNRIIFPFKNGTGWLVYTIQNTGVKEDIILNEYNSDTISFDYNLGLNNNYQAKIESDGSIGIYGNLLFSGNIAATTDEDAELLQKAKENAEKDTLLFSIPAPTIIEMDKNKSDAKAIFELKDNKLKIIATNLKTAKFPLSIDPSIYVATAQQFMNGNNETNINFNVDEQLIEKGRTTGARFDEWLNTMSLPTSSWGGASVAAGGFIYSVGGSTFSGKIYNTQGSDSFVVPSGVTSITVKAWGGGGGGGGGGNGGVGANGGGGGYTSATLSVTPGETLTVYVGGGGAGGQYHSGGSDAGGGGAGGGYTSIYRGSTALTIAAGGGGGGGARISRAGGAGGAGGGTSGIAGTTVGYAHGGGGGTQISGGVGGTNSSGNDGAAGSSLIGGAGADGRTRDGTDGSGVAGGLASGGNGGQPNINTTRAGGGGGGAGYYGGGGGGATRSNNADAGGGGGGGSSYITAGATSTSNTAGSGSTPGNPSDTYRNGAGDGGSGGVSIGDGTSGANGLAVITYGIGISVSQTINWAKFNTSTGEIESANPGSGVCSGWCTTAAYDLPEARSNLSLVAYNGFLYAIGGKNSSGVSQNTIYITKLGANGEPQLWHPTNNDKTTWNYWYQDTGLSSIRSDFSAVAYNNRLYIIGGLSTSGPVNTVQYADITPTGLLGSWTSSTNLPYNLYGHSSQVYNDRLYVIGGASNVGSSPLTSVYYTKINSDGSLNSWVQTTSLTSGRFTNGGNFSVVWGAYTYISGGCSAVNASGYCTTVRSDTEVASINADGSIGSWNTIGSVSNQRFGFGMVAWRDRIYEIGGCSSQNTTTGDCNGATLEDIIYGTINQDGDASTVAESIGVGTAPCSGTNPYNCNLPGTAYIGNMLSATIITNGYLYVIGGCTNNTCSSTSGNVAYTAISSTGQMTAPATCPTGTYRGNTWCVDTTHTISGGIAASSPVVFNSRLYLVGGLDGSGNVNYIYRTTLNSDGSISSWTAQSMTGVGATSVSYSYAYTRANPASAGTNPGNLYIFGGCTSSTSAGCTAYAQQVYKCNIQAAGAIANCSTSGQLQIGVVPGDTQPGLGIMSGTVYANYVYLIGGVSPNLVDMDTIRYAKIDNNNNVVAASGSSWTQSPNEMHIGRRRASAFGYNGYIYVVGGYDATEGVLADIEFIKVNVSDGSLGDALNGFEVSAVTINQRWGLSVPVSNSYAYVIGGCTAGTSPSGCTTRTDVIQTFQVYNNDSGAPAGYSTSANAYTTNPNRIGASSAILNGYIYVAGGCVSATDCTTAVNDVSYAPIGVDGTIGAWSSTSANLPALRAWGKLETAGGSLYYIGGQSNTATDERSEVYYATPSSGDIATWNTASNGLPAARTKFGSTVWNNRIYIVGGLNTSATTTNTVFVSPQLNSGGDISSAWSTSSTSFNVARSGATVVAYANNLYLFGGNDGTNYLSDSQYSQINSSTGNAGNWNYSTSLPSSIADGDGFAANGYVYIMGGRSATTVCTPVTLVAPISANTTISSGNNPTGVGEWFETNQKYSSNRYGSNAEYFDGKAYVIGGGCGATLSYASPVIQQTTLLSQPMVAKYSIMIDTDSDVFPSYWLLNGVDNSIGAKWQLKYRSMTNTTTSCTSPAMTTWGQDTNYGDVTLGNYDTYTPIDSSGINTDCARFYYFLVTVDSSQAFGYPDDVSRGPTITDLTLQFTADPSKRLMHGRTFTGGLQQPDDTPYYSY
ncbi:MAG TPA: hypothetical protein PLO25_01150 [Candidatus Saccharibacteria bacterium]|nr:hypothetical protein [Candidatus Saccharibacteria bacterium]